MQAAVARGFGEPLPNSAILEGHPSKHEKKVRFVSTAIDNEHKMRPRQSSTHAIAPANSSQLYVPQPSSTSASAGATIASRTIRSRSIKVLPANSEVHDGMGGFRETYQQYLTQRPSESPPNPQFSSSVPLLRSRSGQSRVFNSSAYRRSTKKSVDSDEKRYKLPRQLASINVPPSVPDAPSSYPQNPPPAPRPRRLSTPDLLGIDGDIFCACDSYVHGNGFTAGESTTHLTKMDAQLAAAEAHMTTRR